MTIHTNAAATATPFLPPLDSVLFCFWFIFLVFLHGVLIFLLAFGISCCHCIFDKLLARLLFIFCSIVQYLFLIFPYALKRRRQYGNLCQIIFFYLFHQFKLYLLSTTTSKCVCESCVRVCVYACAFTAFYY